MESMSTKYFVKRLKSDVSPLNLSADGHPLCIYGNCHMPRHRFRCCWCNLFHELLHPRYLAPYLKILRVFKEYLLHNISYITPPLPQLYCTETILSSVQSYLIMNNRVRIQTVIKKKSKKKSGRSWIRMFSDRELECCSYIGSHHSRLFGNISLCHPQGEK